MFTGLIEEVGLVKTAIPQGQGRRITIIANKIMEELKVDDSVAINGVCQTVVSLSANSFDVEAVEETIRKTTLGKLFANKKVNLERASKLGDRMGGHLVQGHVDCVGHCETIQTETSGKLLWVRFPDKFSKYVVNTGSVSINGVSLTVAKTEGNKLMVAVIPHTWEITTFKELHSGSEVNLEFDIIGKYIEKMIGSRPTTFF